MPHWDICWVTYYQDGPTRPVGTPGAGCPDEMCNISIVVDVPTKRPCGTWEHYHCGGVTQPNVPMGRGSIIIVVDVPTKRPDGTWEHYHCGGVTHQTSRWDEGTFFQT